MAPASTQERDAQSSFLEQLRTATRQKHHTLNTEIVARLSLCLPPHADSPLAYTKGLIVFGQIYSAFEKCHTTHLCDADVAKRILEVYDKISFHELLRSQRIKDDVDTLKARLANDDIDGLKALSYKSTIFSQRVESAILKNPSNLLAYSWTMYLALFNGGRWIQKKLRSAGNDFWKGQGEALPLSFWDLVDTEPAEADEETLKNAFLDGFREAASLLTDEERRGVIEETVRLFDLCLEMIRLLDQEATTTALPSSTEGLPAPTSLVDNERTKSGTGTKGVADTFWSCVAFSYTLLKTAASMTLASRGNAASPG